MIISFVKNFFNGNILSSPSPCIHFRGMAITYYFKKLKLVKINNVLISVLWYLPNNEEFQI